MWTEVFSLVLLVFLAYVQSVSFSIVSRSRNRNNLLYHIIASVFSNGVWFLTFRQLVLGQMTLLYFPFYTFGTVFGSVSGVKVSMWIEKWLHAESDSHLKPKVDVEKLQRRVKALEGYVTFSHPDARNIFGVGE